MNRIVVLISGQQKRTYPVPNGVELQDEYEFDGKRWTVTAVISREDVVLANPLALPPQ